MTPSIKTVRIHKIHGNHTDRLMDVVAVEEPLQIHLAYWFKNQKQQDAISVTMRTPGYDRELATGGLFSEGIVCKPADIEEVRFLGGPESNEIVVELAPGVDVETWRLKRSGITSSSCGICGKALIDAVPAVDEENVPDRPPLSDTAAYDPQVLWQLPARLKEQQSLFAQTGGLHGAALFSAQGEFEKAFEDVGRHNALDKLIGSRLLKGTLPLTDQIVLVSSRASYELVQKVAIAGGPILAAIGAPSSLAIELAQRRQMTLVGFLRDGQLNAYSGEWRLRS